MFVRKKLHLKTSTWMIIKITFGSIEWIIRSSFFFLQLNMNEWKTHCAFWGLGYIVIYNVDAWFQIITTTAKWEFLTLRSSSSLPVEGVISSSVLMVAFLGLCIGLSAAMLSLCLQNLSTTCASLERLARITSLACVLLLELISKIV